MDLADILLWTFSLILSVLGIAFGFMASLSSSKANKKVTELISNSWANDESREFFFENVKRYIIEHKNVIRSLKTREVSYYEYSLLSAQTRMTPISPQILKLIASTEFGNLGLSYYKSKHHLDSRFKETIADMSLLASDNMIESEMVKTLVDYHLEAINSNNLIISSYNSIINANHNAHEEELQKLEEERKAKLAKAQKAAKLSKEQKLAKEQEMKNAKIQNKQVKIQTKQVHKQEKTSSKQAKVETKKATKNKTVSKVEDKDNSL